MCIIPGLFLLYNVVVILFTIILTTAKTLFRCHVELCLRAFGVLIHEGNSMLSVVTLMPAASVLITLGILRIIEINPRHYMIVMDQFTITII